MLFLLSSHSPSVHPSPPGVGGTITSNSSGPSLTLSLEATAHLLPTRAQNGGHFITRLLKTQLKPRGATVFGLLRGGRKFTHSLGYLLAPRWVERSRVKSGAIFAPFKRKEKKEKKDADEEKVKRGSERRRRVAPSTWLIVDQRPE